MRQEQTRLTHRRIIDAAHALLLDQGYTVSTMAAVAAAAGVSAQTVYNAFGSKAVLVKRVYDVMLVGDDEAVAFAARSEMVALRAEPDAYRLVLGYAKVGGAMIERLGPLLRVLVAGAQAGDPELQAFVDTVNGERLHGATMVVSRLVELKGLRPGVEVDTARDAIWTLNSVEVWSLLVEQRGWTGEKYAEWVGHAMAAAVLSPRQLR